MFVSRYRHDSALYAMEALECRRHLSVSMVKDINTIPVSTKVPTNLTDIAGTLFFVADDGTTGAELWASDGTSGGTHLVRDIHPGIIGSTPHDLANVNGELYFGANDGIHGDELWKSDGTASGTVMVGEVNAGTTDGFPKAITSMGGTIYFFAVQSTYGLWRSDGNSIQKVKDVKDANGSAVSTLVIMDGSLYFLTTSTSSGGELWRSDGTTAGTNPIIAIAGSLPITNLTVAGNHLFFTVANNQLWRSDGTANGTLRLATIGSGSGSANSIANLTAVGDKLFFSANDGTTGNELWWTDGTSFGEVKDIFSGSSSSSPSSLAAMNGKLYFAASTIYGKELWVSDGTLDGTVQVKDIFASAPSSTPTGIVAYNNQLYFAAIGAVGAGGVWTSDGTDAGTRLIRMIPNYTTLKPGPFVGSGNNVFFVATDTTAGVELWKTDGTTANTAVVKDIYPGTEPSMPFPDFAGVLNGKLLFYADDGTHGSELWSSDGTAGGTQMLADLNPGAGSSVYRYIGSQVAGPYLYFCATDGTQNYAWRTDGTAAGTIKLVASTVTSWGVMNSKIYFTDSAALYTSDGTSAGTVKVSSSTNFQIEAVLNGYLYGPASDSASGQELWRSNGQPGGMERLSDINPGAGGSSTRSVTAIGSEILFFANSTGATNNESLYGYDPTAGLASLIKSTGTWSSCPVATVGGKLFFEGSSPDNGSAFWVSDGTSDGTRIIHAFTPSEGSVISEGIADVNGTALIDSPWALYRSDGTTTGTYVVANINSGSLIGRAKDGEFYFGADYSGVGNLSTRGLWRTDGTASGTELVSTIAGESGYYPDVDVIGSSLLFTADDNLHGAELWTVPLDQPLLQVSGTQYPTPSGGLSFSFTKPASVAPFTRDLSISNLTTHITYIGSVWTRSVDAGNLTFNFSVTPAGLPDGNYHATLPLGGVIDTSGDPLPADYTYDFFVLAGDGDRDRTVDIKDFNLLAANFGKSNQTFSQGNYDYSSDGKVTITDFNVLAANFGKHLDAPTQPQSLQTPENRSAIGTEVINSASFLKADDLGLLAAVGLM